MMYDESYTPSKSIKMMSPNISTYFIKICRYDFVSVAYQPKTKVTAAVKVIET